MKKTKQCVMTVICLHMLRLAQYPKPTGASAPEKGTGVRVGWEQTALGASWELENVPPL